MPPALSFPAGRPRESLLRTENYNSQAAARQGVSFLPATSGPARASSGEGCRRLAGGGGAWSIPGPELPCSCPRQAPPRGVSNPDPSENPLWIIPATRRPRPSRRLSRLVRIHNFSRTLLDHRLPPPASPTPVHVCLVLLCRVAAELGSATGSSRDLWGRVWAVSSLFLTVCQPPSQGRAAVRGSRCQAGCRRLGVHRLSRNRLIFLRHRKGAPATHFCRCGRFFPPSSHGNVFRANSILSGTAVSTTSGFSNLDGDAGPSCEEGGGTRTPLPYPFLQPLSVVQGLCA